ncbi:MAG: hypothetical protein GX601_04200 [Anaerolineales bacterium]|nr:hypothetical protein [Anaerolineales bacterium]
MATSQAVSEERAAALSAHAAARITEQPATRATQERDWQVRRLLNLGGGP